MRALNYCVAGWLAVNLVSAQVEEDSPPPAEVITFGIYTSDKPSTMHRQFRPTVVMLSRTVSELLERPIKVRMRLIDGYDDAIQALTDGSIDFARFGPAPYVIAKARQPKLRLLAMEEKNGAKRFRGVFVVHQDSGITRLEQLKNKTFAFGDAHSTIGRYLAQAELLDAGIAEKNLAGFNFLDRHDRVAKAVSLGDYDGGSIKESTLLKASKKKNCPLVPLHYFDNVTKPWIASASLSDEYFAAVQSSLLRLRHPEVLKSLKITRFVSATDDDYEIIRRRMDRAKAFAPKVKAQPAVTTEPVVAPAPVGGK